MSSRANSKTKRADFQPVNGGQFDPGSRPLGQKKTGLAWMQPQRNLSRQKTGSGEWKLMRLRTLALALLAISVTYSAGTTENVSMTIINFSRGDVTWPHINDGVMGGVSIGEMSAGNGYATFRGTVSFDNNGGFSSVRSQAVVHDLSAFEGLVLRVRGDGKRYGFRLKTDASFDGVSYQVQIEPPAGEWTEISVPFIDFIPVYRGRVVRDHPQLDPSRIATFGLIISRQEGRFRIDIESVGAYPADDDQETEL